MRANGNYYGHETEGAEIAEKVCERLKISTKLTKKTVRLVALHMYDLKCDAKPNKIRKLIVRNADIFEELLLLKQADYSACRDDVSEAPCVTKWRAIYEQMEKEGAPFNLKQLAVRGDELIEVGVAPAKVGEALQILLIDCAVDAKLNVKSVLIKRALTLYGK